MRPFKFFQKEEEKIDYFRTIGDVMRAMEELNVQVQNNERVFTDYMDQMDDYFLGGIQPRRNERL
jgi:hypothetical protein